MKLLNKQEYNTIENILRKNNEDNPVMVKSMREIKEFFDVSPYKEFLQIFYLERNNYNNRYPDNRSLLRYLSKKLYVQEPTLYIIRKEIVYKATMIFYKYGIIV